MKALIIKNNSVENIDTKIKKVVNSLNKYKISYEINEISNLKSSKFDFSIVVGGDGSIMKSLKYTSKLNIPLLAINGGDVGYLSSINISENINKYIEKIISKDYIIDSFYLLNGKVKRNNKIIYDNNAINEVLLITNLFYKVLKFKVYVNNEKNLFKEYRGNGIILSTPIGTTAFNFSCGGPIVYKNLNAIIMTPVFAHTFNQRSMIFDDKTKILVKILNNNGNITLDSKDELPLMKDDIVEISKSKNKSLIFSFNEDDYIKNIQLKLKWGKKWQRKGMKHC